MADRHEGKEPARVIAEKPILSLPRATNRPLLRLKLFLKAEKGIFEHGVHQRGLRAHDRQPDPRVEELLWQCAVIGRPLVCRGSASGHRPAGMALVSGVLRIVHSVLLITYLPAATRDRSHPKADFTPNSGGALCGAGIVIADDTLLGVIIFAHARKFVHVEPRPLEFFDDQLCLGVRIVDTHHGVVLSHGSPPSWI